MNIISNIKNIINTLRGKVRFKMALPSSPLPDTLYLIPIALLLLTSCVDEDFNKTLVSTNGVPENLEDYVIIPFSIDCGSADTSSRATTNDDFENGSSLDHRIDFDTPHESFAIFFNSNTSVIFIF